MVGNQMARPYRGGKDKERDRLFGEGPAPLLPEDEELVLSTARGVS